MAKTANSIVPAATPKRIVVAVKVKFELNAKNGLRRVIFSLEKDTDGDKVNWKITFQLFERDNKSDDYGDALVDLDIEVDTALNTKAQTMADDGMTPAQSAHVLGPAAEDVKAAKAGELDQADADSTVQATLKKT